jgi:hypothetical protein
MDNQQKKLLAIISAAHCLRGFVEVYPFIRSAVNNAFKLDWMKGERDDALYWKKQGDVLGRMNLQAQRALEFVPAKEGYRFGTGAGSFHHLASAQVYRLAFDVAGECLDDIVTHYGDFVKALQMEAEFFLAEEVRETLVHEKPNTIATLNAVRDLKDLAEAVQAATRPVTASTLAPAA